MYLEDSFSEDFRVPTVGVINFSSTMGVGVEVNEKTFKYMGSLPVLYNTCLYLIVSQSLCTKNQSVRDL